MPLDQAGDYATFNFRNEERRNLKKTFEAAGSSLDHVGKGFEQRYGLVVAGEEELRHRRSEVAVDAEIVPLEHVADRAGDNRFAIFGARRCGKRSYCHGPPLVRGQHCILPEMAYPGQSVCDLIRGGPGRPPNVSSWHEV
jgi:hypothetical protein